jgi:hypothetical protein
MSICPLFFNKKMALCLIYLKLPALLRSERLVGSPEKGDVRGLTACEQKSPYDQ